MIMRFLYRMEQLKTVVINLESYFCGSVIIKLCVPLLHYTFKGEYVYPLSKKGSINYNVESGREIKAIGREIIWVFGLGLYTSCC